MRCNVKTLLALLQVDADRDGLEVLDWEADRVRHKQRLIRDRCVCEHASTSILVDLSHPIARHIRKFDLQMVEPEDFLLR